MAVLGVEGKLVLQREAPKELVFAPGAINLASDTLQTASTDYLNGDEVVLLSERGLPFLTAGGVPQCPDGFANYAGGIYYKGTNRSHIADDSDSFYANNNDDFYADAPLLNAWQGFVYRDKLNRLSFYSTHSDALNGNTESRLAMESVDYHAMIMASGVTTQNYISALAACAGDLGEYTFSDAQDEVTLKSVCDYAPTYENPLAGSTEYDDANLSPRHRINTPPTGFIWQVVCDLANWSLDLSADSIDTSVVGEKFGEAVKSIVTGGGSLEFMVDRKNKTELQADSNTILHLLMMTEQGCKANAQFYMISNASESCNALSGDLYYQADILITNIALNLRPQEIVAGTANFVSTGAISLKQGSN